MNPRFDPGQARVSDPPGVEHDAGARELQPLRGRPRARRRRSPARAPGGQREELAAFGERLGREETIELGFLANRNPPVCFTHDRVGRRRDEVEYHPAWHALLGLSVEHGLHASPWSSPRAGAHVARAAGVFLLGQIEAGVMCPTTMTYAAVPALRRQPRGRPPSGSRGSCRAATTGASGRRTEKTGVLIGMGMTEKQGGSDFADEHDARRARGPGRAGRRVPPRRAQVVLLRADERRLPRHGAGAGRPVVLSAAALDARRRA